MKKLLLLLCWVWMATAAHSVRAQFIVAAIPDTLKVNANAILRYQEQVFEVTSPAQAREKEKIAYTILNKAGDRYATHAVYYMAELEKLISFEAALYDANGLLVKKLKKADFQDVAAVSDAFYSDSRYRVAELTYGVYPYTVVFEVEKEKNGLMHYPLWQPASPKVSIEQAILRVVIPNGLKINYLERNLPQKATISTKETTTQYEWSIREYPVVKSEAYGPDEFELLPTVMVSATDFEMEGYKGSMATWESYGKWISQLNAGKNDLSEATKAQMRDLVKDAPTREEKIKRVYQYMQSKTRYVGVQLGIGGWQPFPASAVDAKGYGDCKALSFYTHALLDAVGIPSYYTLIQTGEVPILPDFPTPYFNHAILCVPNGADTIWLECTSQSAPFGYLGGSTSDRNVLLITPQGGKMAHTRKYTKQENLLRREGIVRVDAEGNAKAEISTQYAGHQQDERGELAAYPPETQKKWLYSEISIPSFEITSFALKPIQSADWKVPVVEENLQLDVRKCASKSGKRLFLSLNLMDQFETSIKKNEARSQPIRLKYPYLDEVRLVYEIPEVFYPESLPKDMVLESPFGRYEVKVQTEAGKVIYERKIELNGGDYPKESYPALVDFFQQIQKADKMKVVFANKT